MRESMRFPALFMRFPALFMRVTHRMPAFATALVIILAVTSCGGSGNATPDGGMLCAASFTNINGLNVTVMDFQAEVSSANVVGGQTAGGLGLTGTTPPTATFSFIGQPTEGMTFSGLAIEYQQDGDSWAVLQGGTIEVRSVDGAQVRFVIAPVTLSARTGDATGTLDISIDCTIDGVGGI